MIKVAIVGQGYSTKTFHSPLINACDDLDLVAISTSQHSDAREQYPNICLYAKAEEMLQATEADLVVITAPNYAHYSLARMALECGKHVVLEKPMTGTYAEARELVLFAKEKKRLLSVFHNRRWDSDFITVKNLIDQGGLGDVRVFESHFDRFRPEVKERWREQPGQATGVWFDLGSHLVDQALCLFGVPDAITARCLDLRDNARVTDYFHVQLHYQQTEVILQASMLVAGPNRRFNISGTKGSYEKYGLDTQESHLLQGINPRSSDFGTEEKSLDGILYTADAELSIVAEKGNYLKYYKQLVAAINQGMPLPVSGEDAAQVIRWLELGEQSSKTGATIKVTE